MFEVVDALGALAHETRLEIFRLLIQAGPGGLSVSQIGEHVRIPAATLSFHLAHLQRTGLLHAQREGRHIIYSANYSAMNALMGFLTENCCQNEMSCCPETPKC